ncbi:MAG: hypothetical protein CL609_18255 [Anaerolineaceae bacterium]|nr:hypothetical protein [Anaerolineaceae bacterium]
MRNRLGRFGVLIVVISLLSMACFCLPASISDKLFSANSGNSEVFPAEENLMEQTETDLLEESVLADTEMPTPTQVLESEIDHPESAPQLIRQWAVSAAASSEYSSENWSASQAAGEPDVNECGDNSRAWASESAVTVEWLILEYTTPVVPTEIIIYQTYNPSQVVEVFGVALDGYEYSIWQGEPVWIDECPDVMTITIELEEEIVIDQVGVVVDQSIMGWGWNEIDAVELVGYVPGSGGATVIIEEPIENPALESAPSNAPTNYFGWMAESVYQGYLQVVPGVTRVEELDGLIGLTGKKSTENWKPRDDHADTFIYEMGPKDMKAYIGVTMEGIVYKKSITPNTFPPDFTLDTVTKATYDELDAIYKQDKVIPYSVMANILGSPGFLREQYLRQDDGKMVTTYQWYHANGDKIGGIFYDNKLTGIAGLVFIPKD